MTKHSFVVLAVGLSAMFGFAKWCPWLLDYPAATIAITVGLLIVCGAIDERERRKRKAADLLPGKSRTPLSDGEVN